MAENSENPVTQTNPTEVSEEPRKYAILQETSGEESESWLYFIKYQGNEEALEHLAKQLESIDWYILDDLSTFDLEKDYLVSEQTAKEMTKVDLNHYSFHRKFDGTLKKIDLKLKDSYKNEKKMAKVFDVLGYGRIDEFIDGEDIDPEDLANGSGESSSESETDSSESESDSSESESDSTESESEEEKSNKKKGKMPSVVSKKPNKVEIPRFAKAKIKYRK
jgi:hypothetical protein